MKFNIRQLFLLVTIVAVVLAVSVHAWTMGVVAVVVLTIGASAGLMMVPSTRAAVEGAICGFGCAFGFGTVSYVFVQLAVMPTPAYRMPGATVFVALLFVFCGAGVGGWLGGRYTRQAIPQNHGADLG